MGRARHNDIAINEPSISKLHARIDYQDGHFFVEDAGSLHGVYVNAAKIRRAELSPGAQIQLGNVTLKFSLLGSESATGAMAKLPWVEQQQLLLSLVQTLNSTLVLSQVLEQVLDAIMHITGAERGFLLLADGSSPAARYPAVAGLRLRVVRGRTDGGAVSGHGISGAIVRRALETGEVVSTVRSRGEAAELEPPPGRADEDTRPLQTVVCLPLRSPRSGADGDRHLSRAPWAFSTSTTPAPPSRSAATPCARPRPWPDTPPSPSRTPSSSSGSSTRSRSCRRPRSSCCSRRSWRPSARWRPASPTS